MYIWNIKKLKAELIEGSLPEKQQFYYLFAETFMLALFTIPIPGIYFSIWDTWMGILGLIVSTIGIYYLYHINGGKDGQYFLQRYFALVWVISVRFTVFSILIGVVLVFALAFFEASDIFEIKYNLLHISIITLLGMLFFWICGKHLKEVVVGNNGNISSDTSSKE